MAARDKNIRLFSAAGNTGKSEILQLLQDVVDVEGFEDYLTFRVTNGPQGCTGFKCGNPYVLIILNDLSHKTLSGPLLKSLLEWDHSRVDVKCGVAEMSRERVPLLLISMNDITKFLGNKDSRMTQDDYTKLFSDDEGRVGITLTTELSVPRSFRRVHAKCRKCAAMCLVYCMRFAHHKRTSVDPNSVHTDSDDEEWDLSDASLKTMNVAKKGKPPQQTDTMLFPVNAAEFAALTEIRNQRLNNKNSTTQKSSADSVASQKVCTDLDAADAGIAGMGECAKRRESISPGNDAYTNDLPTPTSNLLSQDSVSSSCV